MELRCSAGEGEASNVFRFGGGDLISCEIVTARLLETADGIQREEFFNFDIDTICGEAGGEMSCL